MYFIVFIYLFIIQSTLRKSKKYITLSNPAEENKFPVCRSGVWSCLKLTNTKS